MPPIYDVEYRLLDKIVGIQGYRVGSDGSVWTRRTRERHSKLIATWSRLTQRKIAKGKNYLGVHLKHTQLLVHRLVLEAFLGPCPEGCEARHFPDRDPTNNRLSNLSWATKEQNCEDKNTHGTNYNGEKHHSAVLTADIVRLVRFEFTRGISQVILARRFGVGVVAINRAVRRITWKSVK